MTGSITVPPTPATYRHVAETIEDAALSVGTNCEVVTDTIDNCDVTLGSHGEVDAERIWDSDCTVSSDATVEVGGITNSGFQIDTGGEVTVGGIGGDTDGTGPDWTVEGTLNVTDSWTLAGDCSVDGGTADVQKLHTYTVTQAVELELKGGASLSVVELSPLLYTFASGQDHALVYGTGSNVFECGESATDELHNLYFGDNSVITAASQQSMLDLKVKGELDIVSDFEDNFVWLNWDSRGVDIYMEPITTTGSARYQGMELISTEYGDDTPIFTDVPSNGQFHDLVFSDSQGFWLPTEMINDRANEADGWDDEAVGLFHDVYIGTYRIVDFREVNGEVGNVIKYWGTLDDDQGYVTIRYWYLDEEEWEYREVDDESEPSISDLFIHVQDSIFGDWNGDCEITNSELDDLDDAIEHGPHDPLMDYSADGELTAQIEGAAAYANFLKQPSCGGGESGGGGGEAEEEEEVDLESLAELAQEAFGEEFEQFIDDLTDAQETFDGSGIGDDMAALLEACEALLASEEE